MPFWNPTGEKPKDSKGFHAKAGEEGLNISEYELDSLKELANIGSGNASMALSSIFKRKVSISIPSVDVFQKSQLMDMDEDNMVVGIFSKLREGMDGNVFLFLPVQSALKFVSVIKNEYVTNKEVLTNEDEEILKKVSCVIYSAYIT